MKYVEMLSLAKTDPIALKNYAKEMQRSFSLGFEIGVLVSTISRTNKLPRKLNLGYLQRQEEMAWGALDRTPGAWKAINKRDE